MIVQLQEGLRQEGHHVSLVKLCRWFELLRRTLYYRSVKFAPKVQVPLAQPMKAMIEENRRSGIAPWLSCCR